MTPHVTTSSSNPNCRLAAGSPHDLSRDYHEKVGCFSSFPNPSHVTDHVINFQAWIWCHVINMNLTWPFLTCMIPAQAVTPDYDMEPTWHLPRSQLKALFEVSCQLTYHVTGSEAFIRPHVTSWEVTWQCRALLSSKWPMTKPRTVVTWLVSLCLMLFLGSPSCHVFISSHQKAKIFIYIGNLRQIIVC